MAVLDEQIISADTRDILFTPQALANGEPTGENYGLGFRRNQSTLPASGREVEIVHHGGTALGGRSFLVLIPEENMAVSLLGNYHSGREPFSEFSSMALALAEVLMDDALGPTGTQTVAEDR